MFKDFSKKIRIKKKKKQGVDRLATDLVEDQSMLSFIDQAHSVVCAARAKKDQMTMS